MLQAIKLIATIDADSRPVVLRASDGKSYVTKWIFRRRENRRLINEWIAAPVLRFMGVRCPEIAVVNVSEAFIRQNRASLKAAFAQDFAYLHPGPVFASLIDESAEFVANQPPVEQVTNIADFYAALVADVFLCQGDKRQAIFERTGRRQYRAGFIDNANAMESIWWQFKTEANAVYVDKAVYAHLTASALRCLLDRLASMPRSVIDGAVEQIPAQWLAEDAGLLKHVQKVLRQRQRNLPFLMQRFLRGEKAGYFTEALVQDFASAGPWSSCPINQQ